MSAKLARHIVAWAVAEGDVRIPERVEEACIPGPVEAEEGIGGRGSRARVIMGRVAEGSRSVVGRGNEAVVVVHKVPRPGELVGKAIMGKVVRRKVAGDARGEVIGGHKWGPSAEV
jgi:hypothetical protein